MLVKNAQLLIDRQAFINKNKIFTREEAIPALHLKRGAGTEFFTPNFNAIPLKKPAELTDDPFKLA